jgi:hypothetical protein
MRRCLVCESGVCLARYAFANGGFFYVEKLDGEDIKCPTGQKLRF